MAVSLIFGAPLFLIYEPMANASVPNSSPLPTIGTDADDSNHTLTFVIGFSVLMLFLIMGIAASAFLCITLKKDPYLWPAETNRPLEEEDTCCADQKLPAGELIESTQI